MTLNDTEIGCIGVRFVRVVAGSRTCNWPAEPARGLRFRRSLRVALALAIAVALGAGCAASGPWPAPWPAAPEIRFSLLAVGDTGRAPRLGRHFHRARAVGLGLEAEDRRQPADALLLLGDNFYWSGLQAHELVERIRVNVVAPFCRFVDLSGVRSAEVASACPLAAHERHPIPILALLGNHDYEDPMSPELERRVLPAFVANWEMPEGLAAVVDFPAGVSLVLVDSVALQQGSDDADLVAALARSRGPWRILALHHPLGRARDSGPAAARQHARYRDRVLAAVAQAGVAVQLVVSGHEHNLQVIELAPPGPRLQLVSGSGSRVRSLRTSNPATRFALAAPGFVRIDLVGAGADARLLASVLTTGAVPLLGGGTPRLAARWSVALDGGASDALVQQQARYDDDGAGDGLR